MDDSWKELMPDPDGYNAPLWESMKVTAAFIGKLIALAAVVTFALAFAFGCCAYTAWREFKIAEFLAG